MITHKILLLFLILIIQIQSGLARIEENPCIPDVLKSFEKLAIAPRSNLAMRTNNFVPGRFYTQGLLARFGFENHFQGITRIRDTKYLVVSAANYWNKTAHLFIVEMNSRKENADFGTNLNANGEIPKSDKIISRIDIFEPPQWHAGGISTLGDILIVPLSESFFPWIKDQSKSSRILFYDLSDPYHPVRLPIEVSRTQLGASSVAMSRLDDGRFMLLIDWDEGSSKNIYYSKSSNLEDGFIENENISIKNPDFKGEGLSLIKQCDGSHFYATFKNNGIAAPVINGKDHLNLFKISNDDFLPEASYLIDCGKWCNFSAAASLSVSHHQHLRIYSSRFYRNWLGTHLRFAEFSENGKSVKIR